MWKKIFCTNILKSFYFSFLRYPFAITSGLIFFIICTPLLICNFKDSTIFILQRCLMGITIGAVVSVFTTILIMSPRDITDRKNTTLQRYQLLISSIAGLLTAFAVFFIFQNYNSSTEDIVLLRFYGSLFGLIILTTYILYKGEKKQSVILYLFRQIFFSTFLSLALFCGLCICICAVNYLLYSIKTFDKWIMTSFTFSICLVWINLFLSGLHADTSKNTNTSKIAKFLVLYIMLPLYALLFGILYSYLIKILIIHKIPTGQINWFVSLATAFYVFFYFTLRDFHNRWTILFYRIGNILLIPCIIAQIIAVSVRLYHYGLTPTRTANLAYIGLIIFFIILTLYKSGKKVHLIFPTFAIVIFILTLTPLNLFNITTYEQIARMEQILTRNELLHNGTLTPKASNASLYLKKEDWDALNSSFRMIYLNPKAPQYCQQKFSDTFGIFHNNDSEQKYLKIITMDRPQTSFDCSGYTQFQPISITCNKEIATVTFTTNDNKTFDLKEKLLSENLTIMTPIILDKQQSFLPYLIDFTYDPKTEMFHNYTIKGYVLIK